jgi:hypothetical protein
VLAGVPQELDQADLAQPVQVVDHDRSAIGPGRREVQEPLQLTADRGDIRREGRTIQQVPLR